MDAKIFAILQVQYDGKFWVNHRYITIPEAEREVKAGRMKRYQIPRQAMRHYREIPQAEPSQSAETPAALVAFDVLANVGLAGNIHDQRAARLKLRNYKRVKTHDPFYQKTAGSLATA